ncbi:MAG: hypothetical protein ACRC7O_15680, partial [Fimbriiglobus sp.]
LIAAAGTGGGPRVSVWDGNSSANGALTVHPFSDFFAFEESVRNGVFVAAGDVNGDGVTDLVLGGGPGGGPRVTILSGVDFASSRTTRAPIADFFAGNPESRNGAQVSVRDLDGDALIDVITAGGNLSTVNGYFSKLFAPGVTPNVNQAFDPFNGFVGGVFVG